ncbi:MAG: CRISPR-associated ring nuclease Csm6, partial [Neisseria sp.]|nr:CRISPR-associated ring nuclease Csm6 [Neisseria sp.]
DGWHPDEVFVLTTGAGRRNLVDTLLGDNGFFRRLCDDYGLPPVCFDEGHIKVIENGCGQRLDDIRSPDENNMAADMIVRFIHDLCADPDTELHVSIAGGRKSMGFYIGYALSLFGRSQDRLSHVLVEEAFENNRDFFYPPSKTALISTAKFGMLDAAKAEVMLADIPFVRMREGMPNLTLGDNWNFIQAVEMTQQGLSRTKVEINVAERTLVCGQGQKVELPEAWFALYWGMAVWKQNGKSIRLYTKRENKQDNNLAEFVEVYADCYRRLNRQMCGNSVEAVREFEKFKENLLKEDDDKKDINMKSKIQEGRSRIQTALKRVLGDYAKQYGIVSKGGNSSKEYGLAVPADKISIINEP